MVKAFGYVRVSSTKQVNKGISLDMQRSKIRAWCSFNDCQLVKIYSDKGISGKRADNRPALQQALKAVKAGDVLVVYSLSRLSRSLKNTFEISELLEKKGVDLVSFQEKIDSTSATGKMIFRIMAVMSQFESEQMGERISAALDLKRENKEKLGGLTPFGFTTKGKKLVPHPGEQSSIKLILKLRKEGLNFTEIANRLNDLKILTKNGKKFYPQTCKNIILNNGGA